MKRLLVQLALTRFELAVCIAIILLFVGLGFVPWPAREPSSYGFPFSFLKTVPAFEFKTKYFCGNVATAAVLCVLCVAVLRALIRMRFRLHLGTLIIGVALSATLIFANLTGGTRKIEAPSPIPSGERYFSVKCSSGGWPLTLFEWRYFVTREGLNSLSAIGFIESHSMDWGLFYGIVNLVYCVFLLFGVTGLMEFYVYRKRPVKAPAG